MANLRHVKEVDASFDEDKHKWVTKPNIKSCCKGEEPTWHPEARTYQDQLYCNVWRCFINPDGTACKLCAKGKFPYIENLRNKAARLLSGDIRINKHEARAIVERRLIDSVRRGCITIVEAGQLIDELPIEEEPVEDNE